MARKMTMASTTMYGPYLKSDYKTIPRLPFLLTTEAFWGATYLQFLFSYFLASDNLSIS